MRLTTVVIRWLPKSAFVRGVSVLAGGTASAQAILVLASPLLTRLYSPKDFGVLAVYGALLAVISVVASLRYQLAIPLPEREEDALDIVALSLIVTGAITLASIGIVALFRAPIGVLLNCPELAEYLWLLPTGVLLIGMYQVFYYWAVRTREFKVIAKTKVTQSLVMVGVQIVCHALGPVALIVGRVFGQASGLLSCAGLIYRRHGGVPRIHAVGIVGAAKRYRDFPLFSTWGAILNTAAKELPAIFLAALFSASASGVYLLAHRVLAMPMTLIGKAVADVFFSHAADARRNGNLAPLVAGIHGKLAHISMPPTIVLIAVGPELFALVFGEEWKLAGQFAQWMAPWIYVNFITSPLTQLFSVLGKQRQGAIFQGILFGAGVISLLIGAKLGDVVVGVALYAGTGALCWIGFLAWIIRASGNELRVMTRATAEALAWGMVLTSPLWMRQTQVVEGLPLVLGIGGAGLLIGARYIYLLRRAW